MMKKSSYGIIYVLPLLLIVYCATADIFSARYYRLFEKERKIFLGLRGIDALAADQYINLGSATERALYYKNFWQDKTGEKRQDFEERIEYAFRQFGRHAPLSDDRIPIYVKYGPPSKRKQITPQKKINVKTKEKVKPAEIWVYRKEGLMFDFVRFTRAFKLIAKAESGEKVKIPHLKEVASDTLIKIESPFSLQFRTAIGRFRQKKNLTRLEIYMSVELNDTTELLISRNIEVFDKSNSLVIEKKSILAPKQAAQGVFFDEVNFWLEPDEYRLEIELVDIKNRKAGRKTLRVDLLDYQDDAKKISDLIPAKLIDQAFTHEKFNKPVGRIIPLTHPVLPVHAPFYFYAEAYNLETKNGMHRLKTTYEVTNKEKMRREIVDVMIKDHIEAGDIAFIAAEYHPMDLAPGLYIITLRAVDLLSGEERTAVGEFELKRVE